MGYISDVGGDKLGSWQFCKVIILELACANRVVKKVNSNSRETVNTCLICQLAALAQQGCHLRLRVSQF